MQRMAGKKRQYGYRRKILLHFDGIEISFHGSDAWGTPILINILVFFW